jgi:hypothetical protein
LIGPEWAADPLRANQILSWQINSAMHQVLALNVAGTQGHKAETIGGLVLEKQRSPVCEDKKADSLRSTEND